MQGLLIASFIFNKLRWMSLRKSNMSSLTSSYSTIIRTIALFRSWYATCFTTLVFCENRNVAVLKDAFEDALGLQTASYYKQFARQLVQHLQQGQPGDALLEVPVDVAVDQASLRVFPNIDGVKFLAHEMGCGGTRSDAQSLCGLLAGYITHPNVAGATVLSLGCQNAQVSLLQEEIRKRDPHFDKPLIILEKYWSTSVLCILMSRNRIPYSASLSIISRPSKAPITAISGIQSPEQ